MKDRASKISGLFFFLVLSTGIIYIITSAQAVEKDKYTSIDINGNKLLRAEEYLDYSGLTDTSKYNELTLAEVKAAIEKHPYITSAEVSFDGVNAIVVELREKKPKAVVLNRNKFSLITENCELLPVTNRNVIVGLPIITNPETAGKTLAEGDGFNSAFRIIDAIKLVDENLAGNLAEINLRNGGDIIIMFSNLPLPVVFGKGNVVRKILSLKNIWYGFLGEGKSVYSLNYIDLRYENKIFIGKRKLAELNG